MQAQGIKQPAQTQTWQSWHTFGLVATIAATAAVEFAVPLAGRIFSWLGSMALLAIMTLIISQGVTGLWRGCLIDERNKLSLSRLQVSLWSLAIFPAVLSAALVNVRNGDINPLAFSIPAGIWVLAGINATSLAGTPLIHFYKQNQPNPNQPDTNQPSGPNADDTQPAPSGLLCVNANPRDARWSDIFQGEEIGNADQIDIGKTQLFYFTIILVVIYILTLGYLFLSQTRIINAFPDLNDGLLALLGISNGTYLTNKAVPHTS